MELLKLLHACPEPYREIIYLRIYGDLSFAQIGEIMGKSENWARVTFYRGQERLRKELEQR
jgi:RNA polymerase sigma-70 factor (ECF subfamily)